MFNWLIKISWCDMLRKWFTNLFFRLFQLWAVKLVFQHGCLVRWCHSYLITFAGALAGAAVNQQACIVARAGWHIMNAKQGCCIARLSLIGWFLVGKDFSSNIDTWGHTCTVGVHVCWTTVSVGGVHILWDPVWKPLYVTIWSDLCP